MKLNLYLSGLSLLCFAGQALALEAQGAGSNARNLAKRSGESVEARQLIEPTTVDLKEAAEDVYDQLKEIGGDYATEAEEYLEDMFPEVFDEGITEKPLEHVDEAGVESNDDDVVEINKSHKHGHGKHNGTHGHNSTLPNGNGTAGNGTAGNGTEPIFVPQRYFTEPIITSLIIVFVILLPIVSIGIMALTSIQVPPYLMATSKSVGVSQSKKEQ